MVIKWPTIKAVRDRISQQKKAHRANGAETGVGDLIVFQDGEWMFHITSTYQSHPDVMKRAQPYWIASEPIDLVGKSSSERLAKTLLAEVKENYVLSQAEEMDSFEKDEALESVDELDREQGDELESEDRLEESDPELVKCDYGDACPGHVDGNEPACGVTYPTPSIPHLETHISDPSDRFPKGACQSGSADVLEEGDSVT
jgi:hypothetical protein